MVVNPLLQRDDELLDYRIGGHCQLATVTRHGSATTKILRTWPDRIGERVEPERWAAERHGFARLPSRRALVLHREPRTDRVRAGSGADQMSTIRYSVGNYDPNNSQTAVFGSPFAATGPTGLRTSANGNFEFTDAATRTARKILAADGITPLNSHTNGINADFSDMIQALTLNGGDYGDVLSGGSGSDTAVRRRRKRYPERLRGQRHHGGRCGR